MAKTQASKEVTPTEDVVVATSLDSEVGSTITEDITDAIEDVVNDIADVVTDAIEDAVEEVTEFLVIESIEAVIAGVEASNHVLKTQILTQLNEAVQIARKA